MYTGAIAESGAAEALSDLLARINRRIGCAFEPTFFYVLRKLPFDKASWLGLLETLLDSCYIESNADELRSRANLMIQDVATPSVLTYWLRGGGSERELGRQLRYVVETFYVLEPVFALTAAAARDLLSGYIPSLGSSSRCMTRRWAPFSNIAFASESEAIALLADHTYVGSTCLFPRALAIWPDQACEVEAWLSSGFGDVLTRIGGELKGWVEKLVVRLWTESFDRSTVCPPQILRALDDCITESCRVIPLVTSLRRGLIKQEVASRQN